MKKFRFHRRVLPFAMSLGLLLQPNISWSATLGELTVVSGIDEPLRAEIPLSATPEELASISAKLASQEIFRQSGIDYRASLKALTFAIVRRGEQSFVAIRSAQPIDDPDLRVLLELDWPAGRMIREYALWGAAGKSTSAKLESAAPDKPLPISAKDTVMTSGKERVVQSGETLRHIAEDTRYGRVSLEQMLLGLFNANPDAFVDQNINRLKTGTILNVPEEVFVAAIPEGEAKQFYLSHVGDWNGYRRSLASASQQMRPVDDGATKESSGKVVAQAQAMVPDAKTVKDQLKVDVMEAGAKSRANGKAAAIADRVAQEKALKDAQERLATLEKNVEDLQRLLQVKSGDLARLQQPAAEQVLGVDWGVFEEQVPGWLKNPLVLLLLGAILSSALFWAFRGKSSPKAARQATADEDLPTLSQSVETAPVASAQDFDMTKINLDLTSRPLDDGKPVWTDSPGR